jgi:DNA-binding MarR family transcriptional regulator
MTTAPALNGQIIGIAHHATRAVLDRLLRSVDMTFEQSVVLNVVASADAPIAPDEVVSRVTHGLKVGAGVVTAAIDGLLAAGLLSIGDAVALTDVGAERQRSIRAEIEAITARLYGDLPAEELATAGRVLTTVTARANAMLTG